MSVWSLIRRLLVGGVLFVLIVAWRVLPVPLVSHMEFTAEHRRVLQATFAAWEKYQHFEPSKECQRFAYDTPVALVSLDTMHKECFDHERDWGIPIGCYIETPMDRVILLREDIALNPQEFSVTLGHEYIHLLESCEGFYSEEDHGNIYLWEGWGARTVEAEMERRLK